MFKTKGEAKSHAYEICAIELDGFIQAVKKNSEDQNSDPELRKSERCLYRAMLEVRKSLEKRSRKLRIKRSRTHQIG